MKAFGELAILTSYGRSEFLRHGLIGPNVLLFYFSNSLIEPISTSLFFIVSLYPVRSLHARFVARNLPSPEDDHVTTARW